MSKRQHRTFECVPFSLLILCKCVNVVLKDCQRSVEQGKWFWGCSATADSDQWRSRSRSSMDAGWTSTTDTVHVILRQHLRRPFPVLQDHSPWGRSCADIVLINSNRLVHRLRT